MTMRDDKRISPESLARAQVGDLDQILEGHLDKMLDMEWNIEIVGKSEYLHQHDRCVDVLSAPSIQNPVNSDQLTHRLSHLFTQRRQLIRQSSVIVAAV